MKRRSSRSLQFTLEKLSDYKTKLRKLCHKPTCRNIDFCPRACCSSFLGLHTAIIWRLSIDIEELTYIIDSKFGVAIQDIKFFEGCVTSLRWAIKQHRYVFRSKQFKLIESIMEYVLNLVYYLEGRIKDHSYIEDIFKE
jgi:hypothetical protein